MIGCRLMSLPDRLLLDAARTAVAHNPANKPALPAAAWGAPLAAMLTPDHLALLTSRYWGASGVHLSVKFLDTSDASLKAHILGHMNAWSDRAEVRFSESGSSSADVRIARTPGEGYYSYLGTDVSHIPAGQPTMNLDSFSANTPESEYRRVVRHETGHTLGFPHEHLRAAIIDRLDPEKTIAYFEEHQGWSRDVVIAQVLTPVDESELTANAPDVHSIMCYQLAAEITRDGREIPGGLDIDESDWTLATKVYPKKGGPPPPPPPTGGDQPAPLFTLRFPYPVQQGWPIQFPAYKGFPAGDYNFTPVRAARVVHSATEPPDASAIGFPIVVPPGSP